jgi:hypothetical protein
MKQTIATEKNTSEQPATTLSQLTTYLVFAEFSDFIWNSNLQLHPKLFHVINNDGNTKNNKIHMNIFSRFF